LSRQVGILASSLVLAHVPDLVRYGSKPSREQMRAAEIGHALRSYEKAAGYPPHQVFIGNLRPEELWDLPRPWSSTTNGGMRSGPFGEILNQREFYDLLAAVDQFDLIRLGEDPDERRGEIALFEGERVIGAVGRAHDVDESLRPQILLENLACKASGVHALRFLLESTGTDPASIGYAIAAGEEAIGDRYQRGGGALGKAIAEACGLTSASGSDVKAFCAGPIHALVVAGALVEAEVFEHVVVVAGGSLAKLGMKFIGALVHGSPVLDDVLAGMAVLVGPAHDGDPILRLDAVGLHRVGSGSSQEGVLKDIVARPLERLGRQIIQIDRYATELHNPEITEPGDGGDVAERNYRMIAALAVIRGEMERSEIPGFSRAHGLPGFAPTQGHIASAIPWLPHALVRLRSGEIRSTMLLAKGSLFLGRMTRLWDGISITLEA
jgi:glycine/sarcosine/betaine reductase complex component C subunit beta